MTTQKTPQSIKDLVAGTDARNDRFRIERAKELRDQETSQDSVTLTTSAPPKDTEVSSQKTPQSIKDLVASTTARNERFKAERAEVLRRQAADRRRSEARSKVREAAQLAANLKAKRQARSEILVAKARRINRLREESAKDTLSSRILLASESDLRVSEAPETKNQRIVREFDDKATKQARSKLLVAEARRINRLREESAKDTFSSLISLASRSDLHASDLPETKNQRIVREFDIETKRVKEAFRQAEQDRLATAKAKAATIAANIIAKKEADEIAAERTLEEFNQANIIAKKKFEDEKPLRDQVQRNRITASRRELQNIPRLEQAFIRSEVDASQAERNRIIASRRELQAIPRLEQAFTRREFDRDQIERAGIATSRRELQAIPRLEQAATTRDFNIKQVEEARIVTSRRELQEIPRLEQAITRKEFDKNIVAASELFTLEDFVPEVKEPTKTILLSNATIQTTQNIVNESGIIVGTREILVVKRLNNEILIIPLNSSAITESDIGRGRKEFFVTLPESQAKIIESEQREISQANRGGTGLAAASSRILEGISAIGETTVGGALFVGSSIPFTQENIGALKKFREEFDKAKAEGKDILGALRQAEINTDLPRGVKFGLEAVLDPVILASGGTLLAVKTGALTGAKVTAKAVVKSTAKAGSSVVSSQAGIRPIVRIAGEGIFRASEGEFGQTAFKIAASKLKSSTTKFIVGSERQIALGGDFPDVAIAFGKNSFIVQQKLVPKVTGDVIVTGGQARRLLSEVKGRATSFVPQRLGQFDRSIFENQASSALARAGSSISDVAIKAFKKSTEKASTRLASVAKSAKEGTLGTETRQLSFLGRDAIDIVGQRGSLQVVSKPIFTEPSLNIVPLNIGGKVIKGIGSKSIDITEGVLTPITRLGVKATNISTTFANQAVQVGASTPGAIRKLVARGLDTNTLRDAVKFSNNKNNVNAAIRELKRRGLNVPKRAEILVDNKFLATRGLEAGNVALRSEVIPGVTTATQFGGKLGKSLFDDIVDATKTKLDNILAEGTGGQIVKVSRGLKGKVDDVISTRTIVTRRPRPILSSQFIPDLETEVIPEFEPVIGPTINPIIVPGTITTPRRPILPDLPTTPSAPEPERQITTIPDREESERSKRFTITTPDFDPNKIPEPASGGPSTTFPSVGEDIFITTIPGPTIIPKEDINIVPFDDTGTTPFDDIDTIPFDDTKRFVQPGDIIQSDPDIVIAPSLVPDINLDPTGDTNVIPELETIPEPELDPDIFLEDEVPTLGEEDEIVDFKIKASRLILNLPDKSSRLLEDSKKPINITALKLFRRVTINKVEWTLVERTRQGGRSGFIIIESWGPFKITDLAKSGNIGVIARGKLAELANKQGDNPSDGSDLILALVASGQIEPNEMDMVLPFPVRVSINGA